MSRSRGRSISRSTRHGKSKSHTRVETDVSPPVRRWLAGPMPLGADRRLDELIGLHDVVRAAVLPDVHVAGNVCVGLALATEFRIYPEAAGADIGCGILAVPVSERGCPRVPFEQLEQRLHAMKQAIPIHRQRTRGMVPLPERIGMRQLSTPRLSNIKGRLAVAQFGTLGHGNHFVELMRSEKDGRYWLVVHCGSRGIGQAITDEYVGLASRNDSSIAWIDARTELGRAYLDDATWARRYASANRRAIAETASRILASVPCGRLVWSDAIETAHDFVRREEHFGQPLLVHRKGVQPLADRELGVLPSSMGQPTLIIRGRDTSRSLGSVSHGCGRVMSRREASRRISPRQLNWQLGDLVTNSRCTAEAPQAFRTLHDVTKAQHDLMRKTETLTPTLCYKSQR